MFVKKNYLTVNHTVNTVKFNDVVVDTAILRKDADKAYKTDKYIGFANVDKSFELDGYSYTLSGIVHVRKITDKTAKELQKWDNEEEKALAYLEQIRAKKAELTKISKALK